MLSKGHDPVKRKIVCTQVLLKNCTHFSCRQNKIKVPLHVQMLQNIKHPMLQNKTCTGNMTSPPSTVSGEMRHVSASGAQGAHTHTGSLAMSPCGDRAQHMKAWEACVRSKWVLRTIQHGYRLQFRTAPPMFREIVYSHARGEAAQILQGEIATLLMKGAVRIVPPDQSHAGFYSRYFLVPKKGTQALRPILDLRTLNK